MIDIWAKLVSDQFELALKLSLAVFGLGEREAPVSKHRDPEAALVSEKAPAPAVNPMDESRQEPAREAERVAAIVPEAKAEPFSGSLTD